LQGSVPLHLQYVCRAVACWKDRVLISLFGDQIDCKEKEGVISPHPTHPIHVR